MDKLTKLIASKISDCLLGDLGLDLPDGAIIGTSISQVKGKYEIQLGFFPLDDSGEPEDNPVATWKVDLERTN